MPAASSDTTSTSCGVSPLTIRGLSVSMVAVDRVPRCCADFAAERSAKAPSSAGSIPNARNSGIAVSRCASASLRSRADVVASFACASLRCPIALSGRKPSWFATSSARSKRASASADSPADAALPGVRQRRQGTQACLTGLPRSECRPPSCPPHVRPIRGRIPILVPSGFNRSTCASGCAELTSVARCWEAVDPTSAGAGRAPWRLSIHRATGPL